jgi:hypothetical protein
MATVWIGPILRNTLGVTCRQLEDETLQIFLPESSSPPYSKNLKSQDPLAS